MAGRWLFEALTKTVKTGGFGDARQCDVRVIGMLFGRDAERRERRIGGLRESSEFGGGFDASEEHLREPIVGEEADSVDGNVRFGEVGRQGCGELGEPPGGPFADELGGDVEVGGGAPLQARQGLQRGGQGDQSFTNFGAKIDGGKQTHNRRVNAILPRSFYARPAAEVARALLGHLLVHGETAGVITETEAYLGGEDVASHSARGKTQRTAVIFGPPGHAYIYLNYGLHECLNLVAEPEGQAGCVLLRAIAPERGVELMRERRGKVKERDLANGPGKLTQALGITRALNGADVTRGELRVEERAPVEPSRILTTPRIGITKCADWPLRFVLR